MEFYIHESTFYCNEYKERQKRHKKIHIVTMIQNVTGFKQNSYGLKVVYSIYTLKIRNCYSYTLLYVYDVKICENKPWSTGWRRLQLHGRRLSWRWRQYNRVHNQRAHSKCSSCQHPLFSLICKFGLPFRWPLHDFLDKIWNGYIRIKFKLLENKSNSMFHGLFKQCKPAWTCQYLTPKVDYLR